MNLVSRRHFVPLHELLKHPRTVICVLAVVLVHPQAKSELFSPHAGPLLLESSRRKSGMSFPCIFLLGASLSSRTRCLGHFFPCREPCSLLVFGVVVFPMSFVGCGFQFHFGPLWIANSWVEFSLSVHAGSCSSPLLGLWTVVILHPSWCVVAADIPWFGCCC